MQASVSVVIPTYNCASFLGEAVESTLAQTLPPRQVIVIDDGSTDDTAQVLAGFGERIQVVRQKNQGAAAARNTGIRLADGEFIAFLDADDLWEPNKLTTQIEALGRHPDCRMVHSDCSLIGARGESLKPSVNPRRQSNDGWVFEEFFFGEMSVVLTSSAVVSRSCFDEIGLFDSAGGVVDDYDMFLRLAWCYPVCFVPEPLVRYRVLTGSLSRLDSVERVAALQRTLEKCITHRSEYFSERPALLKQRWRQFHAHSGRTLFYSGRYADSHAHFREALATNPRTWMLYALTAIPGCVLSGLRKTLRRKPPTPLPSPTSHGIDHHPRM